ncbi:DegT/DnrJ/EryC1/StrS family aminotransferase [Facklamia sp. P13064]|uniref:DegT/DnrJ/EryC1/StrS family aminotransferase n=1 Tax=Facklamia sp. P13064 TaxID=3421953 RepID=UPI003D17B6FF
MKKILLSSPHMSEERYEQAYVQEAFDTNWIAPLGANVDGFEKELSQIVGIKYATALASGTAAIHLALKAVGVGQDDIVFCQSLTFSASANPIRYEKAIPVFIDSEEDTWNMDPKALEKAFQKYKPKAVIVVHLYGISAKIDEIKAICEKYNTPLIEDAAESLGTVYKGQWTGTFGDYGIYSFNGNKIITTSGGGMLVSNNEAGIQKAKFWATQARESFPWYQHEEIGYNYRMSNVVAGIGRGQLKVLKDRVEKKRAIYHAYAEGFKDIEQIKMGPDRMEQGDFANHWLTAITIESDTIQPMDIIQVLAEENIEARPVWKPMHLQPVFKDYDYVGGNVAEKLFNKGICLPSDSKMTMDDVDRVIEIVKGMI